MSGSQCVSVICPIYNEEKHIKSCLQSLFKQDYPHDKMELILVDGMSCDGTREIIKQTIERGGHDVRIRLVDNSKRIAASAMNIGIRCAEGDFIIRIDAHASYPENYISRLIYAMQTYDVENAGGECRTLSGAGTHMARGISVALSTRFGMGTSYFRIGSDKMRYVDTVPFGCFRRELFDRIGLFDETLVRNQDDEFNGRIIRSGGKILLLPDIVVDYYGRTTLLSTWKMFYQYGFFKPKVAKKLGKPMTIRQFVPPFFVLTLLVSLLLIPFFPIYSICVLGAVIGLWLIAAVISASRHAKAVKVGLCAVVAYFTVHVAYGLGYIVGIFKSSTGQDNGR